MYSRIRELRIATGWKQVTIAKYLNIMQSTYSNYETGAIKVPIDAIASLADFYNTSVDYLMGLTDVKEPYPRKKKK